MARVNVDISKQYIRFDSGDYYSIFGQNDSGESARVSIINKIEEESVAFMFDIGSKAFRVNNDNDKRFDLGMDRIRWRNVYSQNGNFSGNLTVSGNINGTKVASLVSIDDLMEVFTSEQIAKIESKVAMRVKQTNDEDMTKNNVIEHNGGGISET